MSKSIKEILVLCADGMACGDLPETDESGVVNIFNATTDQSVSNIKTSAAKEETQVSLSSVSSGILSVKIIFPGVTLPF
jgi:hypothetical protein